MYQDLKIAPDSPSVKSFVADSHAAGHQHIRDLLAAPDLNFSFIGGCFLAEPVTG